MARRRERRNAGEPEVDPDLRPGRFGRIHFGGEIRLGGGGPSVSTAPKNLSYPTGPHVFPTGGAIAPLVPTVQNAVDRWFVTPTLPDAGVPAITLAPSPRGGVLLPQNPAPIAYKPPEYTLRAGFALLDVYLPAGTPPTDGWPVLLSTRIAGWFGAPVRGKLDPADGSDALLHKAVNAGFAVLDVGANSSGTSGNPVTPAWFYPPGHPSGRWENQNQVLPDKDVVHAIQWVREQSTFDLDDERIFLTGFSAGAQIALWIAHHPDLASPSGSSQIRRDTSVAGVVALDPISSFVAQEDTWTVANARFESVTSPGQDAASMADVDPALRDVAAPLRKLLDGTSRAPRVPCLLACDEALEAADFSLEPDDHPALRNALGDPNVHDLWNSGMLAAQLRLLDPVFHGQRSELHVRPEFQAALGPLQPLVTGTFTGTLVDGTGIGTFWDTVVAWLVARASEARPTTGGLHLNPYTGVVHGMPNAAQPQTSHLVLASNSGGSTGTTLAVQVTSPPPLVP